ncbi:mediator complex, subunit Med10 [Tricharina praecox]|uniref:mediator complex, subunit Med10 n=1 Tax=Tricharina praecox TaxID=43433 RepID=UPI00221EB0DA|nr:mediator complex, subunit Med10 [Tricharina praecox]KAI5852131.1 mediator complex, subunit Med10 [Tricharina praecox]
MAPPTPSAGPLAGVERDMHRIIQTLYELQVRVHSHEGGAESNEIIATTIKELVDQFQRLDSTATSVPATAALPREVIQYVEDGRNPDIYTREFVELVVKQNQFMNGKRRAFKRFRDVLAAQMEVSFPELMEEVGKIIEGTGGK